MSLPSVEADAGKVKLERLFFALWPDDELRQQIQQHYQSPLFAAGGRPVTTENLHITLAFLGNIDSKQRACVELAAGHIECPVFDLVLNQVGHWLRPRVLWLGCRDVPDVLYGLAAELSRNVRSCGLELDERPYKAHLTLMRKIAYRPDDVDVRPLAWRADRFVLVKSKFLPDGVQYQVVREWPLIAGE